jgi:hypothetical protein
MNQVLESLHYVRDLQVSPLVGVIVAALLAALIDQRMVRRRTADFSAVFRGDDGGMPLSPPPKDMGHLKSQRRR